MPKIVKVTPRKGLKRRKPLSKSPASAGGFAGRRVGAGLKKKKGVGVQAKKW